MTGFTEQRAFDYLPRSQPLQVSTENGGTTRLTHGPEAMDDCSVRTVELGGLPSDSLLRRTLYAAGDLSYTKKASLMTSI